MKLKEQNVLFFTRTMKLGGTENVILQLCEIFKPVVNKIVVCSCGGVNVERLEKMEIKHYEIPDITEKSPAVIFNTIKTLKKIVRNENITVVHSHHRMAALYANLVFNKKIIRIANAHNTFSDKRKFTRIAYEGTKVIAVGEQVKKNLTEFYGLPDEQVTVIHNAIKPFNGQIHPVTELVDARKKGYTLIGNIGRLTEQKGMEYFIAAAAEVFKKCPKARFFIIGDGEDAEKLKNMVKRLLPEGVLTFLGYRSDIQNVITQLDFVVLSSLWEGLPLTPIEAFSVGKTVVATAVDGTPEIVVDGVNGILTNSRNVKELYDGIMKLCKKSDFRSYLGINALKTYKSKFSFEILTDCYIRFYTNIMEEM